MKPTLILSCEHGVNLIPHHYKKLFQAHKHLLQTHRGIDFGSAQIAHYLAQILECKLIEAKASRLLIDCNRSLTHPQCFSEITTKLSTEAKEKIIALYYLPYRETVEDHIQQAYEKGQIIWHFSIHSFTPRLNGITRNADIGLLYDPKRPQEKRLADHLKRIIHNHAPEYRVRKNYPYRGYDDGFTPALRKLYEGNVFYAGIELECNQALIFNQDKFKKLKHVLGKSIKELVETMH